MPNMRLEQSRAVRERFQCRRLDPRAGLFLLGLLLVLFASYVFTPVQVPKLKGHSIQHAAAGGGHTAVVTHAGVLFTFGSGSCGQLGLGSNLDSSEPSQVQGALKGEEVAAVACGEEFTVAITAERGVYVWGLNNCGQVARHRVLLMCC